MKIKKLWVVCLILFFSCTSGSYGSGGQDNEGVDVDMIDISIYVPHHTSGFFDVAERFMEAHPSVVVNVYPISGDRVHSISEYKYINDLRREFKDDSAPDIIWAPSLPFQEFVDNGWIYDMQSFIEDDADFSDANYYLNFLDAYRYNGGIYALPFSILSNCTMIGGNKKLLDELGIAPENTKWSIEDLLAAGEIVAGDDRFVSMIDLNRSSFLNLFVYRQLFSRIDRHNGMINLSDSSFKSLLEGVKTLLGLGDTILLPDDFDFSSSKDLIKQNKILFNTLFMLSGGWEMAQFNDQLFNSDGVFYPFMDTRNSGFMVHEGFAINTNSKNPYLSWEFLRFAMDQKDIFPTGFSINRSIADSSMTKVNLEEKKVLKGILENINRQMYDYTLQGLFKELEPILDEYFDTDTSVDQTVTALEEVVKKYLN